jgi:hypothetical protein
MKPRWLGLVAGVLVALTACAEDTADLERRVAALEEQVAVLSSSTLAGGQLPSVTTAPASTGPAATAPSTTTTQRSELGTRDTPVPPGAALAMGDWIVRVVAAEPDGTEEVLAENMFNEPPAEGRVFFLATLEATYHGTESAEFNWSFTWSALGPSNVAYDEFAADCGVIPQPMSEAGEAFSGGTVTGNICWEVTAQDASDLLLMLEEYLGETRAFFRLSG